MIIRVTRIQFDRLPDQFDGRCVTAITEHHHAECELEIRVAHRRYATLQWLTVPGRSPRNTDVSRSPCLNQFQTCRSPRLAQNLE